MKKVLLILAVLLLAGYGFSVCGISFADFTHAWDSDYDYYRTEEPKNNIKTQENRVKVDVELRGVKSLDDITVTELENSIEVKASTKEKAYFKILTKPPQTRLIKKDFSNGILHLVFS